MTIHHLHIPNYRLAGWAILLALLMLAVGGGARAESQSMATRTEVPTGEWQAIKMRGLPAGARLEVQLEADAGLQVFIVDDTQFQRLAQGGEALFAAAFERRLQFRVRIPASADYFLVLDNRQGAAPRRVAVGITGAR